MLADSASSTSTTPPSTSPTGPTGRHVTNPKAFTTDAGNRNNANIFYGTGNRGNDSYTCYHGGWQNFPPSNKWVEFDAILNYSIAAMQSDCGELGISLEDISTSKLERSGMSFNKVAINSLVDHRVILAILMQECSLRALFLLPFCQLRFFVIVDVTAAGESVKLPDSLHEELHERLRQRQHGYQAGG